MDGRAWVATHQNLARSVPRGNSSAFFSPPLFSTEAEWVGEVADVPAGLRSGAVVRLLVCGWHSPEGERVVVKQSRGDALKPEPEPVDVGERRCSGSPSCSPTGSDPATTSPGKSWGAVDRTTRVSQRGLIHSYSDLDLMHLIWNLSYSFLR
jgi:hypothetical protein